ncbi:chromosome partitioning protein [Microbacterium sp. BE35]|nr:chromosome partitioning protein [Microbacterium sp. BE35]
MKQPDESDAQASFSSDEPSTAWAPQSAEQDAASIPEAVAIETHSLSESTVPDAAAALEEEVVPHDTVPDEVASQEDAVERTDSDEDVAPAEYADSAPEVVPSPEGSTVTQEEESPIAQQDGAALAQEEDDSPIARELADLTARRKALEEANVQLTGRTRVLTVSNQKGGVGKTTTTVNLAAAMAERGAKVLVIDLDPQGNASTALGVPHTADTPSVYDVLIDEFPLADIIQVSPESPNLLCAPSTIHLAGAEIELVSQVAREHRLRVAVDDYLANNPGELDFILIDCPPSLGLLTINAFTAASELLIPIQCEYYALEGLSQLLGTVRMIQKHLNPRLELSTIMLTMYDGRTRLAQQVADEVRAHFPAEVLDTIIPRSVRVSEAPSFGQSVLAYDGQSAGAIAYREAAVEMIRRDSASNERGA